MFPRAMAVRTQLLVSALLILCPRAAAAIELIPVPQNPSDLTVPHPTYNGRMTTFKAIARGCGPTVYFRWDFDANGTWDASAGRTYEVTSGSWYADSPYNIDGRHVLPDLDPAVSPAKLYPAHVEMTCTRPTAGGMLTGPSYHATYPVLVKAAPPRPHDAETGTNSDLDWMRLAASDDALWALHKSLIRSGSGTATITGYCSTTHREQATALFVLAALAGGHRGAYPPGTYNGYGVPIPPGFTAENDWRYAKDPYAEDVIRGINFLLGLTASVTIPGADEADDGTTPIAGTNDTQGFYMASDFYDDDIGSLALPVAAIASSGMAGTVAQVSSASVNGKTFEYIVQQLVDFGVAAQIDATAGGASAMGGWTWAPCFGCTASNPAVSYMAAHWVLALQAAEAEMGTSGVYVNQLLKGGLANALARNQHSDGGPRYYDAFTYSIFEPIGGSIFGCRWLGWDAWDPLDTTPTGYPALPTTRGEARARFDNYLAYANTHWNRAGGMDGQYDPNRGIWKDGNPADTAPNYQADIWTMSGSLLRAGLSYSGATSPITMIGGHDWRREFSMSLVEGIGEGFPISSGLYEEPGPSFLSADASHTASTGHAILMASIPGNLAPVAGLTAIPCGGVGCGGDCCVTTLTNVSFNPLAFDLDGTIGSRLLDFGDGTAPVLLGPYDSAVHRYATSGAYAARLTVTDDDGATAADTLNIAVADVVPEWVNLQHPGTTTSTVGTPTESIYGRVLLTGVTNSTGQGAGIDAMLGYGADGTDPSTDPSWQWATAAYSSDAGSGDEYVGTVTVPVVGAFDYCYRFRFNGGPWLHGDLDGSTNGYTAAQAGDLTVTGAAAVTVITPTPPTTCITPGHPCVEVPVVIARGEVTPVRGYSVSIRLSEGLALCGPGATEGDYLSGVGRTAFQVIVQGGGLYIVDCAILGLPCGATAPAGSLFTLHLGSGLASGSGLVTVTDVVLRDCDNIPIPASPGVAAPVTIDNIPPVAITNLVASQVRSGNDSDGTTGITVTFTPPGDAAVIEVYRKGFGNYPEYDDSGGSVPPTPLAYPPAGWTLTGVMASGQLDSVPWPERDFYYYVAYAKDACENVSGVSNRTDGTLNYHLGDTHNGAANCAGDNLVDTGDISFLGAHYGAILGNPDTLACLDVGPTTNLGVGARPTTDNQIQFEDLMMFAMNDGQVSKPVGPIREPNSGPGILALSTRPGPDSAIEAVLHLTANGDLQGVSIDIGFNPAVVRPVGVVAGELLGLQGGPALALSARPGNLDAAVLGAGASIRGTGELAVMRFEFIGTGDAAIKLARAEGRDTRNQLVRLDQPSTPAAPMTAGLKPVYPNPFRTDLRLPVSLASAGRARLQVFDVSGRLIATLLDREMPAGDTILLWTGADAAGRSVPDGLYLARLEVSGRVFVRRIMKSR